MEEDIKLLNAIYKNTQMGIIGIDNIINDIKNKKLKATILEQRNDYQDIFLKIKSYLKSLDEDPEEISSIAKIMTYIDAKINTFDDKSVANIAMMMIKGSNKGIVEIEEKINDYQGENKNILNLAKELLRIENKNINILKKYLNN